jgi:hypothetical protein
MPSQCVTCQPDEIGQQLGKALQELSRAGPEASEQLPTRLRSGEVFFGDEERKEQETNPEKEKTESADNRSVKLWVAGFPYESLFPDLEGPAEAIGIGALIRIAGRRRADHELTGIPGFPQLVHFTS